MTAVNDSDADNELTAITHTASGGDYEGVTESLPVTVDDDETPNNPAEGQVTITGDLEVGESLTADTSGITDADGLNRRQLQLPVDTGDGRDGNGNPGRERLQLQADRRGRRPPYPGAGIVH